MWQGIMADTLQPIADLADDSGRMFNEKLVEADQAVKNLGFKGQPEGTRLEVGGFSGGDVEINSVDDTSIPNNAMSREEIINTFVEVHDKQLEKLENSASFSIDNIRNDAAKLRESDPDLASRFAQGLEQMQSMPQSEQSQLLQEVFNIAQSPNQSTVDKLLGAKEAEKQTQEVDQSQNTSSQNNESSGDATTSDSTTSSEKVRQLIEQYTSVYQQNYSGQQAEMVTKIDAENPPSFEQFNEQFSANIQELEKNNPEFKKLNDDLQALSPEEKTQVFETVQTNIQNDYVQDMQAKGVDTKEFESEVEAYNKKQQDLLGQIDPAKLNELFGEGVGTIIALFMGLMESLSGEGEEKETAQEKDDTRPRKAGESAPEKEEDAQYQVGEDGRLKPNKPFSEMTDDELAHFKQAENEMLTQQTLEQEAAEKAPPAKVMNAIDGVPGINPDKPQETHAFAGILGLEGFSMPSGISLSSGNVDISENFSPQTSAINFDAIEKAGAGRA
jgi:hypothetical protein